MIEYDAPISRWAHGLAHGMHFIITVLTANAIVDINALRYLLRCAAGECKHSSRKIADKSCRHRLGPCECGGPRKKHDFDWILFKF